MGRVPRLNLASGSLGGGLGMMSASAGGRGGGVRRRSKDGGSGSKRFESVVDALKEFEAILMDDDDDEDDEEEEEEEVEAEAEEDGSEAATGENKVDSSTSSDDAFISSGAVDMDLKSTKHSIKKVDVHTSSPITLSTKPVPTNATTPSPTTTNQRPMWSTGAAREFSRFQLVVDIPVWSSDCGSDYSTLLQLRDSTLKSLHVIIDNLRLRGISTTHRICLTNVEDRNEQGQVGPVYGCIRVAPPFNTPLSKLGPSFNSAGGGGGGGGRSLITDRMMGPLSMRRSTMGPGVLTTTTGTGTTMSNQSCGISPGMRAHEAARIIRDELEKDRVMRGCLWVEEG
jgi:hypothetical protein